MVSKRDKTELGLGIGALGALGLYLLSKNKKKDEMPKESENYSQNTVPIVQNYQTAPTPISISLPTLTDFIRMNSTEINKVVSDIELQLATDISSKVDTNLIPQIAEYETKIVGLETEISEAENSLETYDIDISNKYTNRQTKLSAYNSAKGDFTIWRNYVLKYDNSIQKSKAYYKANQNIIELWAYWVISEAQYKAAIEFDSDYMSGVFENSIKAKLPGNFWTSKAEGIQKLQYFDLEDELENWLQTYTNSMNTAETKYLTAESEYNLAQRVYNTAVEAKTTFYKANIEDNKLGLIAFQNQLSQLKNSLYVSLTVLRS